MKTQRVTFLFVALFVLVSIQNANGLRLRADMPDTVGAFQCNLLSSTLTCTLIVQNDRTLLCRSIQARIIVPSPIELDPASPAIQVPSPDSLRPGNYTRLFWTVHLPVVRDTTGNYAFQFVVSFSDSTVDSASLTQNCYILYGDVYPKNLLLMVPGTVSFSSDSCLSIRLRVVNPALLDTTRLYATLSVRDTVYWGGTRGFYRVSDSVIGLPPRCGYRNGDVINVSVFDPSRPEYCPTTGRCNFDLVSPTIDSFAPPNDPIGEMEDTTFFITVWLTESQSGFDSTDFFLQINGVTVPPSDPGITVERVGSNYILRYRPSVGWFNSGSYHVVFAAHDNIMLGTPNQAIWYDNGSHTWLDTLRWEFRINTGPPYARNTWLHSGDFLGTPESLLSFILWDGNGISTDNIDIRLEGVRIVDFGYTDSSLTFHVPDELRGQGQELALRLLAADNGYISRDMPAFIDTFTVDLQRPEANLLLPVPTRDTITTPPTEIRFTVRDTFSGFVAESLQIEVFAPGFHFAATGDSLVFNGDTLMASLGALVVPDHAQTIVCLRKIYDRAVSPHGYVQVPDRCDTFTTFYLPLAATISIPNPESHVCGATTAEFEVSGTGGINPESIQLTYAGRTWTLADAPAVRLAGSTLTFVIPAPTGPRRDSVCITGLADYAGHMLLAPICNTFWSEAPEAVTLDPSPANGGILRPDLSGAYLVRIGELGGTLPFDTLSLLLTFNGDTLAWPSGRVWLESGRLVVDVSALIDSPLVDSSAVFCVARAQVVCDNRGPVLVTGLPICWNWTVTSVAPVPEVVGRLEVHPNPGRVPVVTLPSAMGANPRLRMTDVLGHTVSDRLVSPHVSRIELLDALRVPAGVYWIEVSAANRLWRTRWVREP